MMRQVLTGLAIILSCNGTSAAGLAKVLGEALTTNVQISAATNKLKSESEAINQLVAQKKVILSANFSGDQDWDLKNESSSNSFLVGINARYLLYDGNLINHQILAEKLRHEALQAEFEGVKQKVIYDAIIAYLNVLRDTKLVELSKKNVDVLSKQSTATESRFQLGELTKTDVAQSRAALEAAKSVLVSRQGALYLANQIFETAVGLKPSGLEADIPLPRLPKSENEAKRLATKFNLNLKASLLLEKRAAELLKASESRNSPTLNLSTSLTGGETSAQQDFSNFGFSLTGTIPLSSGGAIEGAVRKAKADLELSMVNADMTRLTVQQAVVNAWSDFEVSSAVIMARSGEVEASELAYKGTLEETRLGARSILDVLNAEQGLMNAQTNLETAKRNRLAAGYRLLFEMGTLTPTFLGFEGIAD